MPHSSARAHDVGPVAGSLSRRRERTFSVSESSSGSARLPPLPWLRPGRRSRRTAATSSDPESRSGRVPLRVRWARRRSRRREAASTSRLRPSGGFLRFARIGACHRYTSSSTRPTAWRSAWCGRATRPGRASLSQRFAPFEERDPPGFESAMGRLTVLASGFAEAFGSGDAEAVVEQAGEYSAAMEALGTAARAPIVEERLAAARALATRFSGSAKPCGAGGGDVAIAFFLGREIAATGFEVACKDEGLHPIDVSWGAAASRPVDGGRAKC